MTTPTMSFFPQTSNTGQLHASPAALAEHVWQSRPRLLRIARAFGVSPESAEDIAQETMLRAWRGLASLRALDSIDSWLDAICRNQCRMYLRAQRRAPEPERLAQSSGEGSTGEGDTITEDVADPHGLDPLEAIEAEDATRLLERAFAYISPDDRALLEERYLNERPPNEMADLLDISPHALEARVHRARVRLRRALTGPLHGETTDFGLSITNTDAWRPTSINCHLCGHRKLLGRFEPAINGRVELRLRCPDCSMSAASSDVFRSKGIASLEGLRAFRPALTRSLAALAQRTSAALTVGSDVCLHCGQRAPRRVVTAREFPSFLTQSGQRHWVVAPCPRPGCPGLGSWAALDALIGAEPTAQRFIADHRRWVTAPEDEIDWQGTDAIRFQLRDMASAERLTIVASHSTLLTLATY